MNNLRVRSGPSPTSNHRGCRTDRTARANGRDVTFEDGAMFFMGSAGTGAPLDGRDPTEPE